jgi:hypothetical protein
VDSRKNEPTGGIANHHQASSPPKSNPGTIAVHSKKKGQGVTMLHWFFDILEEILNILFPSDDYVE